VDNGFEYEVMQYKGTQHNSKTLQLRTGTPYFGLSYKQMFFSSGSNL
jgi:hypothetical protein